MRKTKIICTIGPKTESFDQLEKLALAGMNVVRLNMSHAKHEGAARIIRAIKTLNRKLPDPVAILLDTQGPEIRTGDITGELALTTGDEITISVRDGGDVEASSIRIHYDDLVSALKIGDRITVDNGIINLEVLTKNDNGTLGCKIIDGGILKSKRHVNLPGIRVNLPAITNKDRSDIAFGIEQEVDFIALSFVREAEDVRELKALLGKKAGKIKIIGKIEDQSGVANLDEILQEVDGIMVARGDLGVEMKPEEVPGLQKRIIRACRRAGKPVIVATQMLESMIESPTPTRAEASDVATAVYDGADALMLSGETAVGDYPIETVAMMDRIMTTVEQDPLYDTLATAPEATSADAISAAARQVSQTVDASAIVAYSVSGATTLRASRVRPDVPILGLTPKIQSARRLVLAWGVHSVHTQDAKDFGDMVHRACTLAREENFAESGDRIIITAGVPFGTPGVTNTLRIAWID